jgi:hypothetical protein
MNSSATSSKSSKPSTRSPNSVKPAVGAEIATTALLEREHFVGQVWDAYNTDYGIMTALSKAGIASFRTSLGFHEYSPNMPNVITEPLPHQGEAYARRGLEIATRKVALLLPVGFLSLPSSKRLFEEIGLTRVYILTKKPVHRKSQMAWLVWEKGNFEAAVIRFL